MSSIHIPPIPAIRMVTEHGFPTPEEALWRQQELQSRSPWTPYTPTTAHLAAITINDCAYVQAGKWTAVRIALAGTSDGTAGTVTLPFKAKSASQTLASTYSTFAGAVSLSGVDFVTLTITKYDGTTNANGVATAWIITGVYEAQ